MIAAASPAEVQRGHFLLVLGEIHLTVNTLDSRLFVEQHPDPARLIAAEQADRGPQWIVAIHPKDHPTVTSRTSPPSALLGPGQLYWSAAITDSFDPAYYRHKLDVLRAHCEDVGRDYAEIEKTASFTVTTRDRVDFDALAGAGIEREIVYVDPPTDLEEVSDTIGV